MAKTASVSKSCHLHLAETVLGKQKEKNRMEVEIVIIWVCSIIAVLSTLGILINRIKEGKGIGLRTIQFSVVTIVFPLLVILTAMKILAPATIAIAAGVIIGHIFAKSSESTK